MYHINALTVRSVCKALRLRMSASGSFLSFIEYVNARLTYTQEVSR